MPLDHESKKMPIKVNLSMIGYFNRMACNPFGIIRDMHSMGGWKKLFKVLQLMKWSFTYFWLGQHIRHGIDGLHPAGAPGTLSLLTNVILLRSPIWSKPLQKKLCWRFSTKSWTLVGLYAMHSCCSLIMGNLSMLRHMHKDINNYSLQSGIWSCIVEWTSEGAEIVSP